MKRKIVIFVIAQLFIIVLILWSIGNRKVDTSTNTLQSENLYLSTNVNFPNYYEPKPNTSESASLKFMGDGYDYSVIYQINSDGMNQIQDYTVEKKRNTFRIITLGDSFTFGENVNTLENYPSILQNILNNECSINNKFEVLNLGVSGYDIQYSLERLKNRGLKYQPDLILWLIAVDQLSRINRLTAEKSQHFLREMKSTEQGRKELEKKPYVYIVKAKNAVVNELGEDKVLAMQEEYIKEINNYYKKPVLYFTFNGSRIKDTHKELLRRVSSAIPLTYFYDGVPDIYKKGGVLPDFHPNGEGHKIIATDIFKHLSTQRLIPCY